MSLDYREYKMHKIVPLTEDAKQIIQKNLESLEIKYKFLGDAIVAIVPPFLCNEAFNGCWTGHQANIRPEQPTQFDYDYLQG